jgi:hypothetical protein
MIRTAVIACLFVLAASSRAAEVIPPYLVGVWATTACTHADQCASLRTLGVMTQQQIRGVWQQFLRLVGSSSLQL